MNAEFWHNDRNFITCDLCFRGCKIPEGSPGFCGVRKNDSGVLISSWLGRFCARSVDPIEKKPFSHWRSGTFIYSLGSIGCNMDCPFCQNFRISKPEKDFYAKFDSAPEISPNELAGKILSLGLNSLAFTYNEPTLQTEYIISCAPVMEQNNIAIALVTNGTMSFTAAKELAKITDAANIDLKAFNHNAYRVLGGDLETVKNNIISFVNAGVHVELTSLIVPGINDNLEDFENMISWIENISREIPLHISRYFPARNYYEAPTNIDLIHSLVEIAKSKLKYVHAGNIF